MIPPFVIEFAIKYGVKIIAVLVLIAAIVGGYFYIKHTGAIEQHAEDMQKLEKRNKDEQKQSDILLAQARAENTATKAKHDQIYIGVLTSASETIKTTQFERDAAISELRKLRQRAATTTSNSNTEGGKANIPQASSGRAGNTCQEISTAEVEQRIEISRMAELALLAAGFIRGVADVK